MDMRQAFPGAHLKAADLGGQQPVLTIAAVVMETIDKEEKPCMKFYETQQDLVLNKTNANTLIEAYGPESQAWIGRQVQLYATRVQFGDKMVDAIRVQVPQQAPQYGAPQPQYPQPQPQPQYQQPAPQPQYPQPPAGGPPAPQPQYQQPAPQPQYQQPAPGAPAPVAPVPGGYNPLA